MGILLKREFSSFDMFVVVRELNGSLLGSSVSNVYQLDAKTLLLKLRKANCPPLGLVLGAGRRLHLTAYAVEKPSAPPAFCMALRKYLRDAGFVGVEQHEFERVVVLSFRGKEGDVRLVVELFGDGNFVLIDGKGVILQALVYKRMRDRNILRGEAFAFAPSSSVNPLEVDREEFSKELRGLADVEVVRVLARFLGIGGLYAEEVLLRSGVEKTTKCGVLSDADVEGVFVVLQGLLSQVKSGGLEPCVVLDEAGGFVDVAPVRLKRYEGFGHQPFASFNEALDEFYSKAGAVEKATAGIEVDALKREAERYGRIVGSQEKTLAEAEARAEQERQVGDAIYAHMGEIQALLDRFEAGKQAGKDQGETVSEILNEKKTGLGSSLLFEGFDRKGQVITVCVDGLRFGLVLQRSLYENASGFYERGKRAKQKLEGAKAALEDSRKKLAEVEAKVRDAEVLQTARPAEALEKLAESRVKGKEWFEKFRWFVSSDGFLVVAGKDAVSNEVLVKKHVEAWDVVFHSEVVGAPFVAVKTEGKEPTEQVLHEAAEFAASFSRGWREGFGSVDVYWVRPEQLSKKGPSGEYVAHGAFVVNGKRNWHRNTPLRIAVGAVCAMDGSKDFVGGPVDAVKAKTKVYVEIVPGDVSGKELMKRILGALAVGVSKEARGGVLGASVEEIREFVPYGVGRIVKG